MRHTLEYNRETLTDNEHHFIQSTVAKASHNNFMVQLINKQSVMCEGQKVNGFVSESPNILATAVGKSKAKWILTLLHESCHMDQCIERADVWKKADVTDSVDASTILFLWLDHLVEFNKAQLKDYTQRALAVELDCEKRVVEKANRYGIEIDSAKYAQTANAYVYFYLMVAKTRKWYAIGKEPYNVKEVWSQMPAHFNNDYTKLPRKYALLYKEHC